MCSEHMFFTPRNTNEYKTFNKQFLYMNFNQFEINYRFKIVPYEIQ